MVNVNVEDLNQFIGVKLNNGLDNLVYETVVQPLPSSSGNSNLFIGAVASQSVDSEAHKQAKKSIADLLEQSYLLVGDELRQYDLKSLQMPLSVHFAFLSVIDGAIYGSIHGNSLNFLTSEAYSNGKNDIELTLTKHFEVNSGSFLSEAVASRSFGDLTEGVLLVSRNLYDSINPTDSLQIPWAYESGELKVDYPEILSPQTLAETLVERAGDVSSAIVYARLNPVSGRNIAGRAGRLLGGLFKKNSELPVVYNEAVMNDRRGMHSSKCYLGGRSWVSSDDGLDADTTAAVPDASTPKADYLASMKYGLISTISQENLGNILAGIEAYLKGDYSSAVQRLELFRGKEQSDGVDNALGIYMHSLAVRKANTDSSGQIDHSKNEWSNWLRWKAEQLDSKIEEKANGLLSLPFSPEDLSMFIGGVYAYSQSRFDKSVRVLNCFSNDHHAIGMQMYALALNHAGIDNSAYDLRSKQLDSNVETHLKDIVSQL